MNIKLKNILINFSLLTGSFLICLLLLEVVVRLFFPSPKTPVIFDETIGFKHPPNSNITVFVQGNKIENKVNSLGFLDQDHSYQKTPGVYRIVFLGDSMTEATNVQRQETFSKILEGKLNQIYKDRIEVINLGINGFGTAHEYLTLQEYGLKFSPDLVVLVFYVGNDIENNYYKLTSSIDPAFDVIDGELVQIRSPAPLKGGKLRKILSGYLQFPRFLTHQFSKISFFKNFLIEINLINAVKDLPANEGIPFSIRLFSEFFNKETEKLWQITQALIFQIKNTSENNDADFLVIILPIPEQQDSQLFEPIIKKYPELADIDMDLDLPQKTLKNYLADKKINYLDLLPGFKKIKDDLYFPPEDGGHYNIFAHKVVAEMIFEYFQDKNLIKIK